MIAELLAAKRKIEQGKPAVPTCPYCGQTCPGWYLLAKHMTECEKA